MKLRSIWTALYAYLVLSTAWHIGTARNPLHATWVWAVSWAVTIVVVVLAMPVLVVVVVEAHHLWLHHRFPSRNELRDDVTGVAKVWWRNRRHKNEGTI